MAMNAAVGHRHSHVQAQRQQQRVLRHNSCLTRLTRRRTSPAAVPAGTQAQAGLPATSVDDAVVSRLLSTPLAELMHEAAAVRDDSHPRIITFSPKVGQACCSRTEKPLLPPASGAGCTGNEAAASLRLPTAKQQTAVPIWVISKPSIMHQQITDTVLAPQQQPPVPEDTLCVSLCSYMYLPLPAGVHTSHEVVPGLLRLLHLCTAPPARQEGIHDLAGGSAGGTAGRSTGLH